MKLKIKTQDLELEVDQIDVSRFEKVLFATFAYLDGQSFVDTYQNTETTKGNVKNYAETRKGVKVINGVTLYQCTYKCGCGDIGKRFVKEEAEVTTCHKCKAELKIAPAAENDAHDEEFNYFVAY